LPADIPPRCAGISIGRCIAVVFPIGLCAPAFIRPLFMVAAERCAFTPAFARAAPFQFGREPMPYPAFALTLPRPTAPPMEAWLTTGRAKLRGAGAAALMPALAPSLVAAVGLTSNLFTGLTRLSWLGETRIEFRATFCELSNVCRETAVKPFGARIFA
jgi:hypothetical protein